MSIQSTRLGSKEPPSSIVPSSGFGTGLGESEPLAVSPRRTAFLLDCGVTRVYELINSGELESYKDGSARKVTTRSIHARIDRLLRATARTA
jgi:hypothetical protein